MSILRDCSFYRESEALGMGCSIGYCNLICDQTICGTDIHFCEIPDILKQYLIAERRREEWEKKRNVPFSGHLKA
jgi:hypothetical protein